MKLICNAIVKKVFKKSQSPAFKDLQPNDLIDFTVEIKAVGRNKGTYPTYIECRNLQSGKVSKLSFNQIGRVLSNFEFEQVNVMYESGKDAGYNERYEDGFNEKISTLKLHPTEAVVMFFDENKICFDECKTLYEEVERKFPNNTVIVLPDSVSLEGCSKDVLENIISMISEIIDKKL